MVTFFSNTDVGYFGDSSQRVYGNLMGNVSRDKDYVTLSSVQLILTTHAPVSGTKNFVFDIDGTSNNISINVASPNTFLGNFKLSSIGFVVSRSQTSSTINWYSSDGSAGSFVVNFPGYPDTPTISSNGAGFGYISITYGTTSFRGANGHTLLFGGKSSSPETVIDFTDQVGDKTFNFADIEPDTIYYFRAQATNEQFMSSFSEVVSVRSLKLPKFYGSVDGKSRLIKKMYCSVDGIAKPMKFYGSVDGKTKRIL